MMKLAITGNYLKIPVNKNGNIRRLRIFCNEQLIWEFRMPVEVSAQNRYPVDFYAVLPVEKYQGAELTLELDTPDSFWEAVVQSKQEEETEVVRPGIHFTPVSGWMNDPNGLYFQNGEYHLYFQYNPFHVEWENMCWGHAVSEDLLHWKQKDTVMFPDEDGVIFSGCAVLNEHGLADLPKDIPLFFYTSTGGRSDWAADKKVVQKMAYSMDGGKTLCKVKEPVVEFIVEENRDPKVYWHEGKQHYYMVLYLTENEFAIFVSNNLKEWKMTQRLPMGKCNECPDLRRISCDDGSEKWMFWSADGYYCICSFDGEQITEIEKMQEACLTKHPYAAQTYVGVPGERVISVSWLRAENAGENFTGYQSLPRELTLQRMDGEYVLCQKPIQEYFTQREAIMSGTTVLDSEVLTVELLTDNAHIISTDIFGTECSYDKKTGLCRLGDHELEFAHRPDGVQIIWDGKVVEVTDLEYRKLGVWVMTEMRKTGVLMEQEKSGVRLFVNR